jgi:hypothetical protein
MPELVQCTKSGDCFKAKVVKPNCYQARFNAGLTVRTQCDSMRRK